ncbi:MAG TPA: hypothetical protein VNU68_01260 [Verrucomicrobiae bacterium]|nr:hypothetical protein [Verrucomicrobiae bacterium]
MDRLTRKLLEVLLDGGARESALFSGQAVELGGQTFTPDETKGYFKFCFSHAFPVVTAYGQGLHPNVVAISYNSLLHQPVNFEHQMVAYDKDKIAHDKVLGSVVAVEFPRTPGGRWTVSADKQSAPAITGVASFAKLARSMDRVVGKHQTGRHNYSVSMEVQYAYADSMFAVELKPGAKANRGTPDDMARAGWEVIPMTEADDELLATFSVRKKRIVSDYRGARVYQLMGGLDKPVHYAGMGVVHYPAEQEAQILQMAASRTPLLTGVLDPLRKISGLLKPQ